MMNNTTLQEDDNQVQFLPPDEGTPAAEALAGIEINHNIDDNPRNEL